LLESQASVAVFRLGSIHHRHMWRYLQAPLFIHRHKVAVVWARIIFSTPGGEVPCAFLRYRHFRIWLGSQFATLGSQFGPQSPIRGPEAPEAPQKPLRGHSWVPSWTSQAPQRPRGPSEAPQRPLSGLNIPPFARNRKKKGKRARAATVASDRGGGGGATLGLSPVRKEECGMFCTNADCPLSACACLCGGRRSLRTGVVGA